MVAVRKRKKINRDQLVRRQRFFTALVAITGILTATIIHKLIEISRQPNIIVTEDKITSQNDRNGGNGIAAELAALNTAIAQLETEKVFDVPSQFQGKIIRKIKPKNAEKVIALTFDDGPWPKTTSQVLDILRNNQIRATFFLVGQTLQKHPELGRQIVAESHAIANHTWHHGYNRLTEAQAAKEINDTANLIYQVTGLKTAYFRPPGGALKNGLAAYAQKNNYAVMMWSVDSGDSHGRRPNPQQMINTILKTAKPGGIVLMHDGGGRHDTTVKALPKIIDGLRQQGYQFVTIPELLDLENNSEENIAKSQTETLKNLPIDAHN